VLDLTRATEQSAIVAASLLGCFVQQPKWQTKDAIRNASTNAMYGYLTHFAGRECRTVVSDERDRPAIEKLHGTLPGLDKIGSDPRAGFIIRPVHAVDFGEEDGGTTLELCVSPIDGKTAINGGLEGGSLSAIAGGPQGWLRDPKFFDEADLGSQSEILGYKEKTRYFLIAVSGRLQEALVASGGNPEGIGSLFQPGRVGQPGVNRDAPWPMLHPSEAPALPNADRFGDALVNSKNDPSTNGLLNMIEQTLDLQALSRCIRSLGARPTFSLLSGQSDGWMQSFGRAARCRVLQGSSVANALTAFLSNHATHASFSVARRQHTIIAAVLAKALGGEIYAVPLQRL